MIDLIDTEEKEGNGIELTNRIKDIYKDGCISPVKGNEVINPIADNYLVDPVAGDGYTIDTIDPIAGQIDSMDDYLLMDSIDEEEIMLNKEWIQALIDLDEAGYNK